MMRLWRWFKSHPYTTLVGMIVLWCVVIIMLD